MLDISGAVAVITGGASGIGLSVAEYWKQNGGKVVLGDIAEDALKAAADKIGGDTATVVCDVTNENDYSSTKAAMSVMPKVLTAEFFRRGLAEKIRCVAVAPGYVGTPILKGMNQKALGKILEQVPIGRLVEPEEVASLIGELYRNEALSGDVFYIHGGLRLSSKG